MSDDNKTVCFTIAESKTREFRWVIFDFPVFWNQQEDAKIVSPIFNVGSDDDMQFKLQIYKDFSPNRSTYAKVDLCCVKRKAKLPTWYTVSIMKNSQICKKASNYHTFREDRDNCQVLNFPEFQVQGFVSSFNAVSIICELSVFIGDEKNVLKNESVDIPRMDLTATAEELKHVLKKMNINEHKNLFF